MIKFAWVHVGTWLLSLIETLKLSHDKLSGKEEWFFDRGASYYMAMGINVLNNASDIQPLLMGLTNGA